MEWELIELKSWNDFISLVNRNVTDSISLNNWFFRGQANSDWELQPSLLRCFEENNKVGCLDAKSALEIEGEAKKF